MEREKKKRGHLRGNRSLLAKERFPFRSLNLPLAGRSFLSPSEKADWGKGKIKKPACFSADNF